MCRLFAGWSVSSTPCRALNSAGFKHESTFISVFLQCLLTILSTPVKLRAASACFRQKKKVSPDTSTDETYSFNLPVGLCAVLSRFCFGVAQSNFLVSLQLNVNAFAVWRDAFVSQCCWWSTGFSHSVPQFTHLVLALGKIIAYILIESFILGRSI